MKSSLKIAVGSKNPVKIDSARSGFQLTFPDLEIQTTGHAVSSGVSDQPMSSEETLRGATNRANALRQIDSSYDFYVGIEGGIEVIEQTLFANAWIVILDRKSKMARGRTASFPLPPEVKRLVESGMELGHANDEVFAELNSKQGGGAVGSLTQGLISRRSLYEHAMVLALIPVQQNELFYPLNSDVG